MALPEFNSLGRVSIAIDFEDSSASIAGAYLECVKSEILGQRVGFGLEYRRSKGRLRLSILYHIRKYEKFMSGTIYQCVCMTEEEYRDMPKETLRYYIELKTRQVEIQTSEIRNAETQDSYKNWKNKRNIDRAKLTVAYEVYEDRFEEFPEDLGDLV